MKPASVIGRWRTFLRVIRGTAPVRPIQRLPDQDRLRQQRAARQAVLSDQTACGRVLSGPHYGDIR